MLIHPLHADQQPKTPYTIERTTTSHTPPPCDIVLEPISVVAPGQVHESSCATSTTVTVRGAKAQAITECLLDSGSGISLIDASLANELTDEPLAASKVSIRGIGRTTSAGCLVLTVVINGEGPNGACSVAFDHELHVVSDLPCRLLLGTDVLKARNISMHLGGRQAELPTPSGRVTFPVQVDRSSSAETFHVIATQATTIPAEHHAWVPVHWNKTPPSGTIVLETSLFADRRQDCFLVVPNCLVDKKTKMILVSNLGSHEAIVPSNAKLAYGQILDGQEFGEQHTFPLFTSSDEAQVFPVEVDIDAHPFSEKDDPNFQDPPKEVDKTALVDGIFNVGVGEDGTPPPELVSLLRELREAMTLDGTPGHVDYPGMPIPLMPDAKLQAEAPRRVSPEKREVIEQSLEQLLAWGVIEPSKSPLAYPVVLIRQNGKWRFCTDFRKLNDATIMDRYPIPRPEYVFEALRGHSIFSALDAAKGYYQVDLLPEDRWKTAFACHQGLYQYKRVPFGLKGAPGYFQRFMDTLLGGLKWKSAMVYLDDVIVFSSTMEDHLKSLRTVLQSAIDVGLKFSPQKCFFGLTSLKVLGRKVSAGGIDILEDKARAIRQLKAPETYYQLDQVTGLFEYYQEGVPRFGDLIAPLHALKKNRKYVPNQSGNRSSIIVTSSGERADAKTLKLPWTKMLDQCFTRLRDAVANCVQLGFADYELPFLLYVDASGERQAAALHQQHLIRLPDSTTPESSNTALPTLIDIPMSQARLKELKEQQEEDPLWSTIINDLAAGEPRNGYQMVDGLLTSSNDGLICLPEAAIDVSLAEAHRGHWGFARTLARLRSTFWHPRLTKLVEHYVRTCRVCLRTKLHRRVGRINIDNSDLQRPYHTIAMDVMLGLPKSDNGLDACLILVDTFSKAVHLHPTTRHVTAADVTHFIETSVLRQGWKPERIISDNDSKFVESVGKAFAEHIGAKQTPSVPHHQQANPAERYVQTVQRVLRSLLVEKDQNINTWPSLIPAVELAMNETPSTVTGLAPFDITKSFSTNLIDHLQHSGLSHLTESLHMSEARLEEARKAIRAARDIQKDRYDRRHGDLPTIREGDLVLLRLPDRPLPAHRLGNKLEPPLEGPFTVKKVISDHRIELDLPAYMEISHTVDISQVEKVPPDDGRGRPDLLPEDPTKEYEAVEVLAERLFRGRERQLLIRWKDSSIKTWEFEDDIADGCQEIIDEWDARDLVTPPLPPTDGRAAEATTATASHSTGDTGPPTEVHPLYPRACDALDQPSRRSKIVTKDGKRFLLKEIPLAFSSKEIMKSDKDLVGPELELSGLGWAYNKFRHFLEGSRVVIITDHSPLPAILRNNKELTPRLERFRTALMPYLSNMSFVHRAGRSHVNVDALSRLEIEDLPPLPN